ncbi:hypothetical protein IQ236_13300 [Planktothrix mougeotii LEGE 06226]|uniref:FdxN element excision controlling factor protein n=1 Tax=Planktothrix mougeotii LEGE 06226 TaxID=1828728 RepID=A0ABR9UCK1_9CYAN|nr:hypothetical protein [Planktothrix mougeotii LEGE 06226]
MPLTAYESFFYRDLPRLAIQKYQVKLIVYEPQAEVILEWIN